MKITAIALSVFELPATTRRFDLVAAGSPADRRWRAKAQGSGKDIVQVMHVETDEGIEGVSTVGDARYTAMRTEDLEELRLLALGADPFDRDMLDEKLHAATRRLFTAQGWFGAFDNCLWDIAGKAAGLAVANLLGRARDKAPCYYNFFGKSLEAEIEDAQKGLALGFPALKDHFEGSGAENVRAVTQARKALGDEVDLLHDAAVTSYTFAEALSVGRALEECRFRWFEEPLSDRDLSGLGRLCDALDIPVLGGETLMNDRELSAHLLLSGSVDLLRGNARHGTTPLVKLAHLAETMATRIELNGPGGLFGLVHTHLCCALRATTYYEFFPGGSRDERGKEIGLTNPPLPQAGYIAPPTGPGWGAEWDWTYFKQKRVAVL
ncbi:MAG: hypothetical protein H6923_07825 [Alphaproteobacteria bacterium]|nr:hypothetical protein [Alphaproteobacteria bacterium]